MPLDAFLSFVKTGILSARKQMKFSMSSTNFSTGIAYTRIYETALCDSLS